MITCKIDVKQLDKLKFFAADSGKLYCTLTLIENRDGPDKYGNDFFVVQDIGKEARDALAAKGLKPPILGNAKWISAKRAPAAPRPAPAPKPPGESSSAANLGF